MAGEQVAEMARRLVGVAFRAQGRDTKAGLDCVGLVMVAHGISQRAARDDYRMRGAHGAELRAALKPWFWRVARTRVRPGDVLLLKLREDQWHLAIATVGGMVHADARRRRVVEIEDRGGWPVAAAFRRRVRKMKGQG